ncbi:MAG: helix-turn-helix domain-containing protein [Candidatus Nanosynbacter sp.]|nr:helix-turn-helix domain-containing protein [Candidatus Nanosynbacter sp.]
MEKLRKNSKSIHEIVKNLECNVSTISRELKRNQISQRKARDSPCFFIYNTIALKSAYLSAKASSIFLPVFLRYFFTK